jgi:hypothetical protein
VNADAASKINVSQAAAIASLKDLSDTLDKSHVDAVAKVQAKKDAADKAGDTIESQKYQGLLVKLGKSPIEGQAQQFSAYALPISDAFSWLIGQYIAARQLAALKQATTQAQPKIEKAGIVLDQLMAVLVVGAKIDAAEMLSSAEESWRHHRRDRDAIAQYEAAAIAAHKVLAGSPTGVFSDMAKAHDQLTEQIAFGPSSSDAFTALQTFASQAQAFLKAVSEIQSASDQLRKARQKS